MIVDKEKFQENFRFFDKEIVLEIIIMFINEFPERMTAIKQNVDDLDMEKLRFNAHSLKGVVANFMADDTQEVAKRMELKGKENDTSGLPDLYQELYNSTSQLVDELNDLKIIFQ